MKYYLRFVVLILSENLITDISRTYILPNVVFFFEINIKLYYLLIFYLNVPSFLYLIMH